MASAKRDFEEFVRWLHLPTNEAPFHVRRLANLILANFDAVLATSLQRSQRSVLLVDLAQRHLLQTPDALPEIAPAAADGAWLWRRLHHLTVGPFRGFRHPEPFDLPVISIVITFYLLPRNWAEQVEHLGQFSISKAPLTGSVFGRRQQLTQAEDEKGITDDRFHSPQSRRYKAQFVPTAPSLTLVDCSQNTIRSDHLPCAHRYHSRHLGLDVRIHIADHTHFEILEIFCPNDLLLLEHEWVNVSILDLSFQRPRT